MAKFERRESQLKINQFLFNMTNSSKYTFLCFMAIVCLAFFAFSPKLDPQYSIKDNTVVIRINKAKLGITVWSDEIIQVRYTLADSFSTKKSLFIEEKNFPKAHFKVRQTEHEVGITTAELTTKVNTTTGQVSFFDRNGHALLKEKKNGGKSFSSTSFEGYQTQNLKQQFESPADEAIYGMGQHQDRLLNIKGYDLDLYQHNTEVYIPFFVSTKGYGLLWNNLSHAKFNSPDSIVAIAANQLFDKRDAQGGLTLSHFKDDTFKEPLEKDKKTADIAVVRESLVKSAKLCGYLLKPANIHFTAMQTAHLG